MFGSGVITKKIQPMQRLRRMREMFAETGAIYAEDYAHFTQLAPKDAAKSLSKALRRLGPQHWPQDPRRN